MRLNNLILRIVCLCWCLTAVSARCVERPALAVGILPTFNAGSDHFGPVFSQHLTLKLFESLESQAVQASLLNPGGFYNPNDNDFLIDYGRENAANFLVITVLQPMQVPDKGNCTITVTTELMDLKSGTRLGPWQSALQISKHDARLDYRTLHMNMAGDYYIGPSRLFEKQPLGKAMAAIAEQVRMQVLQALQADVIAISARQRSNSATAACDVQLKILYPWKHAASKSYTMFVNGEDESLGASDGVLQLHNKSGTMLLQWSVNDAPYKLPKQQLYQAATNIECSKPQRRLNIEIGGAGEALLKWTTD